MGDEWPVQNGLSGTLPAAEVLPSPAVCSTPQADWVRWSLAVRRSPTIMTFQSHCSRPSHDFGLGGGLRFTCSFRSRLSPGQGQSRQYYYRPTPTRESSAKSGADNHMDNKPSSVEHYVREVWKSLRTRLQKRCVSRGYHPVCRARSFGVLAQGERNAGASHRWSGRRFVRARPR